MDLKCSLSSAHIKDGFIKVITYRIHKKRRQKNGKEDS
jgi:hypothetical protein